MRTVSQRWEGLLGSTSTGFKRTGCPQPQKKHPEGGKSIPSDCVVEYFLRALSNFTLTKLTFKYFDTVHYVPGTRNSLQREHQLLRIRPNWSIMWNACIIPLLFPAILFSNVSLDSLVPGERSGSARLTKSLIPSRRAGAVAADISQRDARRRRFDIADTLWDRCACREAAASLPCKQNKTTPAKKKTPKTSNNVFCTYGGSFEKQSKWELSHRRTATDLTTTYRSMCSGRETAAASSFFPQRFRLVNNTDTCGTLCVNMWPTELEWVGLGWFWSEILT